MKFKVEVFVARRPHMRDQNLEFMLHVGKDVLENLFDHEVVDEKRTNVVFWFPERWCNIVEERSIFTRLERLYPKLEWVQIVTQSVYIMQCVNNKDLFIFQEDSPLPQESQYGRLWLPNHNVPNFSKVQCFSK